MSIAATAAQPFSRTDYIDATTNVKLDYHSLDRPKARQTIHMSSRDAYFQLPRLDGLNGGGGEVFRSLWRNLKDCVASRTRPRLCTIASGRIEYFGLTVQYGRRNAGKSGNRRQSWLRVDGMRAACLASGIRVPIVSTAVKRTHTIPSANRRDLLAFVALLSSSAPATRAQSYKRSFRERFETSISSATHDYSFEYPDDWSADIVSLNDGKLYGVDTRYKSDTGNGQLAVSVLPFVGADSIKDAGTPEDVLQRFEELIGAYWEQNGFGQPGRTPSSTSTSTRNGVDYYYYELVSPHNLISACIVEGELYLMVASCGARSWKNAEGDLRVIVDSFTVPP